MEDLIIATHNKGKLNEFKKIFEGKYNVIPAYEKGFTDDVEETGKTFYENALIKAKAVSEFCHADALADDSGLEVDALNGAPGVFSARYAGEPCNDEANNKLLLKNLSGAEDRSARFVCALVLYKKDGRIISGNGACEGEILHAPDGDGGFGYDPLFYSYALEKSFASAGPEEKNQVSHRSAAVRDLLSKL